MNFDDTPEEAAFRAKVRAWIAGNAPRHLEPELRKSAIPGMVSLKSEDPLVASKAWQKTKAQAGFACPSWPKAYGGGGLSPIERVIWQQEEGIYGQLSLLFSIGFGMCGPTLMGWADEAVKARLLPPMITGEEIWCQLFSEPSAGSDLGGLRTRAERAADGSGDWIINGQKIWTSYAHYADWGLLLTRTDPTVPKHKGLTMFFLNMKTPGVDVRQIKQANGQATFNEVFFDEVRIPDAQRLGPVGQGWQASLTTLMNERASIGATITTGFDQIFALASRLETPDGLAIEDRAVRSKLADWAARASGLKYTNMRAISALSRGETPGPENSIGKLVASAMKQDISMFALDLQGRAGVLVDPELAAAQAWFQANLLRAPGGRIEGGSDEILRNVIAERVLGLPPDIRVDKTVPFNEIPTSGRGKA
jgi:alkylation response protein AidB-like acyl-CoA dehydrogenase